MPGPRLNAYLRWSGFALSIIAVAFVATKLRDYGEAVDLDLTVQMIAFLAGLSMVYGTGALLLVLAWKGLLEFQGVIMDTRSAIHVYGTSQLAKYLPGNVFQFVGRQALGLEAGVPAWKLAKSVIWEIGLLTISGSFFVLLLLPGIFKGMGDEVALLLFGLAILLSLGIIGRVVSPTLARSVFLEIVFLGLSGLVFFCVLAVYADGVPTAKLPPVSIVGVYVIGWLAGLLTPGAPAGAGIREVLLFSMLHTLVPEPVLLTAIVLGRMVTVGGDLMLYVLALAARVRSEDSSV